MEKAKIIDYWRHFFSDLLVGTFKSVFLFSLAGFGLGMLSLAVLKTTSVDPMEWSAWLEWPVLGVALAWFGGFGVLFGLAASVIRTTQKKLSEMMGGIHDLLDLLTREVMAKFSRFDKKIPREDLARQFDNLGQDFKKRLQLKRGILGWLSGLLFGIILKALKFFFLDEVVTELLKKPADHITPNDIENAVRRVGVEMVLSPITDNLILLQVLNCALIIFIFGIPFGIFRLFD